MAERKSREYYDRIRKYFKERGYKTKKYVCKFPNERGKQVYSDTTYVYSNKNVIVCIVAPPKTRTKCIVADRRDSFDRWSNCIVQLPMMQTERELQLFFKMIESLNEYSVWADISDAFRLEYFVEDYDKIPIVTEAVKIWPVFNFEKG